MNSGIKSISTCQSLGHVNPSTYDRAQKIQGSLKNSNNKINKKRLQEPPSLHPWRKLWSLLLLGVILSFILPLGLVLLVVCVPSTVQF